MPQNNGKQFHHMAGDGLQPPPGYRDIADTTNGSDFVRGGNAPDIFYCYDGDDQARGNKGPDQLFGMDGNDILRGGRGPDVLNGGEGDDMLHGGRAGDDLTGGAGADTFSYRRLEDSTASDHDTMQDFQSGIDLIVLRGEFKSVTASDVHITDDGLGGCVVTIDGYDFELASKTAISIGDFVL